MKSHVRVLMYQSLKILIFTVKSLKWCANLGKRNHLPTLPIPQTEMPAITSGGSSPGSRDPENCSKELSRNSGTLEPLGSLCC